MHYTSWVLMNGTAVKTDLEVSGFTFSYTGHTADMYFQSAMATFIIESIFSDPSSLSMFTSADYVHLSGNGSTMIGPSTVAYSNYTANTLPLNIETCDSSASFTKFFIQTGVVHGTTGLLVTQLAISGSQTYNGSTTDEDFTLMMTSVTKA